MPFGRRGACLMYEDFLQKVPLFAELPGEDLTRLCQMIQEVRLSAGEMLFAEGSLADRAYILYEGELEIIKHVDGREVYVNRQNEPGTVIGEMALLEETTRLATVRARSDSFLLTLDHRQVHELMNKSPNAARIMLHTLSRRWRALEAHVRHNEQMAQLGTLTAGIAHELNNPVAAVMRGAGQLQAMLTHSEQMRVRLDRLSLTVEQQMKVSDLHQLVQNAAATPLIVDALTRSDREEELETWLKELAIFDAWELTPSLVDLGLERTKLNELATLFTAEHLPVVLRWLCATYSVHSLLSEIMQGAGRMADIVKALKSYVYLDQAPVQNVDIHAGLDNTLIILRHKLTPDIRIRRDYAPDLPQITAYGSELNQVWTNILDNAIDALDGRGEIIIQTSQEADEIVVEIVDNGPGIPPTHLPKIFDPFFTTKSPGKGAGLGLNISYNIVQRQQGEISVTSEPGRTVFQVRLPVNFPQR